MGAFGVAGIVLAIGARASFLAETDTARWLQFSIISCGVGRFGANVTACFGKYPWEEGMGRDIVRNFGPRQLFFSFAATLPMLPLAPMGWAAGIISSIIGGAALSFWAARNLGGVNGDVLGASEVLCEVLVMAGCSIQQTAGIF